MSNSQQVLVLGEAGRIDPSAQLQATAERVLAAADLRPARAVEVAPLDGADLPSVTIDLTGCAVDDIESIKGFEADGVDVTEHFDSMHANAGLLWSLDVRAEPITLFGADVSMKLELQQVPIVWMEDVEGRLGVTVDEDRRDSGMAGSAVVSVGQNEAVDALQKVADALLASENAPFKVEVQQLRLTQIDARSVRAEAIAKVSKGFLGARATADATLSIDRDLVLHVSDIALSSRNPVILAGLKVLQSKLEIDPIELADFEIAGARLQDVTITADERLTIRALLG